MSNETRDLDDELKALRVIPVTWGQANFGRLEISDREEEMVRIIRRERRRALTAEAECERLRAELEAEKARPGVRFVNAGPLKPLPVEPIDCDGDS